MKKLIVLSGKTNSGKSQTLKLVIDSLIKNYKIASQDIFCDVKRKGDRKIVFKIPKLQKIIGINTAGDYSYDVNESLDLFTKFNCDIVVCATKIGKKIQNGSVGTMQNFIKNNNQIEVLPIFKIMFDGSFGVDDQLIADIITQQVY